MPQARQLNCTGGKAGLEEQPGTGHTPLGMQPVKLKTVTPKPPWREWDAFCLRCKKTGLAKSCSESRGVWLGGVKAKTPRPAPGLVGWAFLNSSGSLMSRPEFSVSVCVKRVDNVCASCAALPGEVSVHCEAQGLAQDQPRRARGRLWLHTKDCFQRTVLGERGLRVQFLPLYLACCGLAPALLPWGPSL